MLLSSSSSDYDCVWLFAFFRSPTNEALAKCTTEVEIDPVLSRWTAISKLDSDKLFFFGWLAVGLHHLKTIDEIFFIPLPNSKILLYFDKDQ